MPTILATRAPLARRVLGLAIAGLLLAGCAKTAEPPAAADPAVAGTAQGLDNPTHDVPPATAPAASAPATSGSGSPAVDGTIAGPRYDGYGDLRFGMTAAEATAAWGGELNGAPGEPDGCYLLRPKWAKVGDTKAIAFLVEGGKFQRYDVGSDKEAAPGGGKVGMTEAQLQTLYGAALEAQPHKYVDGGKYLRARDPAGGAGSVVFETGKDGVATAWHVGVPPQVDYVERCG